MPMPDDAFGLIVTLHVKPEHRDELMAMLLRTQELMRREATFLSSTIHVGQDDPDRIVLHETWRDRRNFEEVEFKREYRREYEATMPGMLSRPRELSWYDVVRADHAFPGA